MNLSGPDPRTKPVLKNYKIKITGTKAYVDHRTLLGFHAIFCRKIRKVEKY